MAWLVYMLLQRRTPTSKEVKNQFILNDLKQWMEKTRFTHLNYHNGEIRITEHEDPELDYWNEDVKVLKEWGIYDLWEGAINNSKTLKNNGVNVINELHKIVDEKLKNIPLKHLEILYAEDDSYSFPRVCETIFEIINGHPSKYLDIRPRGSLQSDVGVLTFEGKEIACGKKDVLRSFKSIIEDLTKDENVKRAIDKYNKCEKNLSSREPFKEFEKQIENIIANFRFYQDFRPHS